MDYNEYINRLVCKRHLNRRQVTFLVNKQLFIDCIREPDLYRDTAEVHDAAERFVAQYIRTHPVQWVLSRVLNYMKITHPD